MKVKQIVMREAADQQQVYTAHQEMREKNPQYAAEVAKLPGMVRGIGPDAQKHNKMVWDQITKILQKYKALPVQEELPAPGQELGTIGAVKPDGTVEVKKADGSSTVVQQQELKPGATPNTLTMPVPKINPGEKVMAAPVAESSDLTAMLRIAGLR